MKTLRFCTLLLLSYCFVMQLDAQLENGSIPPDWTATDLDGNVWTLSDIISSEKHVVIDFAAVWCGLCWNYHQTDIMQTLHDLYGPNGTDQIRVFFIEADLSTNTECLYGQAGCNVTTFGSWVDGHDHPFISIGPGNANSMSEDYAVNYYPLTYAINGFNNTIYETGAPTDLNSWNSWLLESFEMSLSATIVDAICPGEGSIELTTNNGAGTISYVWSDGLGNSNFIDELESGSYTVTATDENDYQIVESYSVDGPATGPVIIESSSSTDVGCNGDETGALNVDASGGNGGYTYSWNNGATGSSIDGLAAGSYSVVATDIEGCTGTETFTVYEPALLTLSIQTEDANCGNDDGQAAATASGGIPPRQYDFGNGMNESGNFTDIEPGEYIMTVTDFNGCVEVSPFTINTTEAPEAVAEADGSIECTNVEVLISGQGSTEGNNITYAWTTEDGSIVEGSDEIEAMVDAAGTYSLVVTDNETGCAASVQVIVDANIEFPTISIEDPEVLNCNNETTLLNASESSSGENFSYQWSTDDGNIINGANEDIALIDEPGSYTLLVTNTENGCTSEQSVIVNVDDESPAISVEDQIIDCTNTEVELCASIESGTLVTWTTQDGEIEATCITVSMSGIYIAEALGSNGCIAAVEAEVSLSSDLPQVSIMEPETLTCTVPSITLLATLDGNPSDYNILWTAPTGEEINNSDLSLEVDEPGQYTLVVTNPLNGCTTTSAVTVDEIIVNPIADFTSIIDDGIIILSSTSSGEPSGFSWSFGSTDENTETTFDQTGTYEVCLTVSNDCGEDTHCEEVYFVSQLLFESSVVNTLCFAEAQGSIDIVPSGGEPDYTISWVGPNGFTASSLSIIDLKAGEYSMVLQDSYGYEKSESFLISEPDEITEAQVDISHETNNDSNGSINIDIIGGTGILSYEWSNGAQTASISALVAGNYTVIVTDENGCSKEFGPYIVENATVGLVNLSFVNSMRVYPIPATENVNILIELNEVMHTQMNIFSTSGKLISKQTFNRKNIQTQIDITNLPPGVYYIEFGNENTSSLEKFVVIR